jgi:hypothetical protein
MHSRFALLFWCSGVAATEDLEAEALTPTLAVGWMQLHVWAAWQMHDRERALDAALAVPESTPPFPATASDCGAGWMIGTDGTEDQIRARLTGAYSKELKQGLLWGIKPGSQRQYCAAILKAYEDGGTMGPGAWSFLQLDEDIARKALLKYISDPTPANLKRLHESIWHWSSIDADWEVSRAALSSDNRDIRKTALRDPRLSAMHPPRAHYAAFLAPRLLEILDAAAADAEEKRLAALALGQVLGLAEPLRQWFGPNSSVSYGTPKGAIPPLGEQEETMLEDLRAQARAKLNEAGAGD